MIALICDLIMTSAADWVIIAPNMLLSVRDDCGFLAFAWRCKRWRLVDVPGTVREDIDTLLGDVKSTVSGMVSADSRISSTVWFEEAKAKSFDDLLADWDPCLNCCFTSWETPLQLLTRWLLP